MADDVSGIMQGNFDDVPDDVFLTTGEYIFRITGFKPGYQPNEKRTPFVQWTLRPVGIIDSTLEADDLLNAYPVYDKLWLSDAAKKMAKRWFENVLGMDTAGSNNDVLFETAVGMEVRARVIQDPPKEEGKNPYVKVDRYFRHAEAEAS
jgi:hypothetical protein